MLSKAHYAALAAALLGLACDRVIVARIVGGYDIATVCADGLPGECSSWNVDAFQECCYNKEKDVCRSEPFSAHRLRVEFDNRYPATEQAPDVGWEYLREYSVVYVPEFSEGGPDLTSQIAVPKTIPLPPDSRTLNDDILLVDFFTKEEYATFGGPQRPSRYSAEYELRGDNDLFIELDGTFLLGSFDNCGVLGKDFASIRCSDARCIL